MTELFNGILIGLCVSVPVGPIGILCMNYALSRGFRVAVMAGLGAALADTFYGMIAGMGVHTTRTWFIGNQFWIASIGGIFLCMIGISILNSATADSKVEIRPSIGKFRAFGATFFLTLTNPITIFTFATLFGCLTAIPEGCTSHQVSVLLLGVFIGSMLWWVFLSSCTSCLKERISFAWISALRRIAGFGIIIFGFATIIYSFILT